MSIGLYGDEFGDDVLSPAHAWIAVESSVPREGAPVFLSAGCVNLQEFEWNINRLHGELEVLRRKGQRFFAREQARRERQRVSAPAER